MFERLDQVSQQQRKMIRSSCRFLSVKTVISVDGAIRLTAFTL